MVEFDLVGKDVKPVVLGVKGGLCGLSRLLAGLQVPRRVHGQSVLRQFGHPSERIGETGPRTQGIEALNSYGRGRAQRPRLHERPQGTRRQVALDQPDRVDPCPDQEAHQCRRRLSQPRRHDTPRRRHLPRAERRLGRLEV